MQSLYVPAGVVTVSVSDRISSFSWISLETSSDINLSPTLANTVNRSAKPALVIHIFSPFRM
jgi:hypothetical protein